MERKIISVLLEGLTFNCIEAQCETIDRGERSGARLRSGVAAYDHVYHLFCALGTFPTHIPLLHSIVSSHPVRGLPVPSCAIHKRWYKGLSV